MKTHLWILFAGALVLPASGGAQVRSQLQLVQLPPGTSAPQSDASVRQPPAGQSHGVTVSPDLAQAEAKIDQRDFEGARTLVEKYLSAHSTDARALFDLGYLDQQSGRDDAAMEEYRKAVAADPSQFESRLALGLMLAGQGKPDQAREQLQKATLLAPSAPNAVAQAQAFRALAALDRTSDPGAAKDALLSALRISPETPQDLLLTAQIAEGSDDSETAEAAYRRLLSGQPQGSLSSQATSGLVHLLLKEKKYSDAEPLLKSALTADPDDPSLNAQLAAVLIAQGENDAALPALEKLRQLEPRNASVDQMLADAYSQAGHPEKADPIYAEMAQARPQDPEVLTAQGRNMIAEQRYPQAQGVFARAVKLKPEDGDAWTGLAIAASQNGQYSIALQALSMRAKYLPETPASYFLWATAYDNLRERKAAEEYYGKFLASAKGKFPDQEWQARQRLAVLTRTR